MSALLTQIRALLPAIVTQTSWDQAADEDRFEGYVFALVLEAARKEVRLFAWRTETAHSTALQLSALRPDISGATSILIRMR